MNYKNDNIIISEPAPGHYVIQGYSPQTVFVEGVGYVIPTRECYVAPEIPSDALIAILEARGENVPQPEVEGNNDGVAGLVAAKGKRNAEFLASKMYTAYCESVGGKAFNGDDLPAWKDFRADDSKKVQSDAWVTSAQAAIDACAPSKTEGAE